VKLLFRVLMLSIYVAKNPPHSQGSVVRMRNFSLIKKVYPAGSLCRRETNIIVGYNFPLSLLSLCPKKSSKLLCPIETARFVVIRNNLMGQLYECGWWY